VEGVSVAVEAGWLYAAVAAWFIAGCIVSHYARRGMGRGVAEYFIANRRLAAIPSALTYAATTYSAFMLVGLVGWTYSLGSSAHGFELTYLIGTVILLVYFAPRIWAAGRLFGYVTPSELLAKRFESRWVGLIAAFICVAMIVPYASVQFMGIGYLVEGLTDGAVPFAAGALIAMVPTLIYAYWAGMRSVAWTDALQAFIMIVTSLSMLLYAVNALLGGWGPYLERLSAEAPELLKVNWPLLPYLGLVIPWFFFALSNPQVFQRYYVPKDVATLRRMIWGFAVFGFLYTVISTQFGFICRLVVPGLEPKVADRAMPLFLTKVPAIMAVITFTGIVAAAVSTIDSIVLTLSSMVGRDIYRALRPGASEDGELLVGKLFIPVFAVACFAFAMLRPGPIVVLSAMSSGGMLVLVPSIFAAFLWRRATAPAALLGMVVGVMIVGMGYFLGVSPLGVPSTIWGLAASAAILYVGSYVTKPPAGAEEFMRRVGEELKRHEFY
jgi:SSS family solute:Na+ symporter